MICKSSETIDIEGKTLSYLLVRSDRRKRSMALKILPDRSLQVNTPSATGIREIEKFILSKYHWIQLKLSQARYQVEINKPEYKDGERILFLGKEYVLIIKSLSVSCVKPDGDSLVVYRRNNASVKKILLNWYKDQAVSYFSKRTYFLAQKFEFPEVKSVFVRRMKARWGSCSSDSCITYNTNLIKLSTKLIDSVILHELCHLIYHNHSRRFYQLLAQVNPDWMQDKKSLNAVSGRILLA